MISLALVIDGLFKMVFACLWMVLADFEVVDEFFEVVDEFFEVVLGRCRSFLRLVTTVP